MNKKILYVVSSGPDTPERLYAPFILGSTARAMDVDADIFFFIKGVMAMKKGVAETIQLGSFPPLNVIIGQAASAGVKFFVCEESTQLLGIPRGDFIDGAIISGAVTLNDLALDADAILNF
jgi:hypothetical protein